MKEGDLILLEELTQLVGYKQSENFKNRIDQLANVFRQILSPENDRVVEFGPGISPKSLFTLSSIDFQGSLDLVDIDPLALAAQNFVYSRLKPNFNLRTHQIDLFDFDINGFDVVFCNHLIDDLVAADFAIKHNINYEEIFNNPEKQIAFWRQITEAEALALITRISLKLVEADYGSKAIINHYEANFDRSYKITGRNRIINNLFDHLRSELISMGFRNIQNLPDFNQGEECWLILEKI